MKKIWLIILTSLITFFITGFLTFHFRSSSFITKLTDNPWIFTTLNQLAKVTDIPFSIYQFSSNQLPTYQLFVKGQDLEALKNALPDLNQTNLMVDFNSVPATFLAANGISHKVNLKYRGNTSIHWAHPKKSLRLSFKNKADLNGLKAVDLIIPEDRGIVLEHLANFRAKKLGLLAPDSWFANLTINQKSQGLYYVTEKIDQNFINRRQLTGTLFGEKDDINNWSTPIYTSIERWRIYPEDPHHPDYKHLRELIDLINQPDTTTQELLTLIDLDNFLNWQVHSLLMASFAQEGFRNNRLFYNHRINKFQLIPWDTGSRHESYQDLDRLYNPLADRLLADLDIRTKRNKRLESYISNPDNLTKDLDFFETSWNQIRIPLMQDNVKFYPNIKYLLDIKTYRSWLTKHFDNLLNQL